MNDNEWYESSDGFFTYYVNKSTGEKKLKLEEDNILVDRQWDDEMFVMDWMD